MTGGGGDVVPVSSRAQKPTRGGRRGHRQKAAWLPLDVIVEIAARSDPATLVRCAATCRDARRRIAEDPSLLCRLRLRDTGRFVLPLLRGHLTGITTYIRPAERKTDVYMVDTTGAADATRLVKTTDVVPLDSRGGLILIRKQGQLLVCNPASRRSLVLPPEPAFPGTPVWYTTGVVLVLLVINRHDEGDDDSAAAVGRHFQVLKAKLESFECRPYRRMLVHTFSSEHGAWSPLTEISTPYGCYLYERPLVVGDVVHWLCMRNGGNYMLVLRVGAARVNVTSLPASFPGENTNNHWNYSERRRYLLATASAGGNPVVLVADTCNISAWEQSKHTRKWRPRSQVVIENETIKDDLAKLEGERRWGDSKHVPELLWFGESSGAVLLRIYHNHLFWLDLHSKKIVRCFSDSRLSSSSEVYCPYEVDLSSWVPTFSSAITL